MKFNETKYRKLFCASTCIVGVLVSWILGLITFSISDEHHIFKDLLEDWSLDPIEDLYIPLDKCENSDTSVFRFDWPGIPQGCVCVGDLKVTEGDCCGQNSKDKKTCCKGETFSEINGREVDQWRLNDKNVRLCARRLKGYNYRAVIPLLSSGCHPSEKLCGKTDLVTKEDMTYCVPQDRKCPIQEIIFTDSKPKGFEMLTGISGIYVLRDAPNKLPLSQFKVSVECVPSDCPQITNLNNLNHNADSGQKKSVSSDFRTTLLELNEKDYYDASEISSILNEELLEMNLHLESWQFNPNTYVVLQKSYMNLRKNCRKSIGEYFVMGERIENLYQICKVVLPFCLLYSLLLLAYEMWIGFFYTKYLWGLIVFRSKIENLYKVLYIIKLFLFLMCISSILLLIIPYFNEAQFIALSLQSNCLEGDALQELENIGDKLYQNLLISSLVLIIFQFCIDPNLWYLILTCVHPDFFHSIPKSQIPKISLHPQKPPLESKPQIDKGDIRLLVPSQMHTYRDQNNSLIPSKNNLLNPKYYVPNSNCMTPQQFLSQSE